MARIRALKIGFFKNEALTEFSPWHRLLFAGLWLLADKSGRLEYRPKRIKAELFPYDRVNVEEMVSDLTAGDDPFLVRYQVDGRELLAIQNFSKHQRPHHTEPDSEYPGPNKKNTVRQPLDNGEETDEHRSSTPGVGVGVSNGVGVEEGKGGVTTSVTQTPVLLMFPTVGVGAKSWPLTEAQVREWQTAFPGVDVLSECRKALAWVRANQAKTPNGMAKFLVRWLGRSSDDLRTSSVVTIPTTTKSGRTMLAAKAYMEKQQ